MAIDGIEVLTQNEVKPLHVLVPNPGTKYRGLCGATNGIDIAILNEAVTCEDCQKKLAELRERLVQ